MSFLMPFLVALSCSLFSLFLTHFTLYSEICSGRHIVTKVDDIDRFIEICQSVEISSKVTNVTKFRQTC